MTQTTIKPIIKTLHLSKMDYYTTHLFLINAMLPIKLTTKEIEVLALFMSFDGDLAKDRFGTTAKKLVRENMNPKISHAGLSNYISSLENKKIIQKNKEGKFEIRSLFNTNSEEQIYQFKLVNLNI